MSHWSDWTYLSRTCPDIGSLLLPLEHTLRLKLLPSLTTLDAPNDVFRDLFALPSRHGGLGLPNPESALSSSQYSNSLSVCKSFVDLVVSQHTWIPYDVFVTQSNTKASIHKWNCQISKQHSESVRSRLSPQLQRLFDIANENGRLHGMHYVYGMVLNPHAYPLFVLVALFFQLIIVLTVIKEALLFHATMVFMI